jgi:hypothetical protein
MQAQAPEMPTAEELNVSLKRTTAAAPELQRQMAKLLT